MPPAPRPQWQQATALITIGAGGIATGLSFVPRAAADLTTPASIPPVTLLALEHANAPAPGKDAMLRAAIVHIARHFQRLAETRSPAEMEAMIWQYASTDGTNHGPSCGAFASLTLELGSHIAGVENWVTGGTSYPWPVHSWVDGRVDPNRASPGVVSILQDARSHGRWRPLRDGYTPQPGDWVLFDGHVEVVTKYHGGVLHTIGGDSLPNLSVNAHEYADPLRDQGVAGFVDNGVGMSKAPGAAHAGGGRHGARAAGTHGRPAGAPIASAHPSPSSGPGSKSGPLSGGGDPGSAASTGTPSSGRTSGSAAASADPVTTADTSAQQAEFAPRAIPAPRTFPRSRYAQVSRALPAQGAGPAAPDERASGPGTARTAAAARSAAGPQHGNRSGEPAARSDRAPHPADQRHQQAGRGRDHAGRSRAMTADVPATGLRPARPHHARRGQAAIPGLFKRAHQHRAGDAGALAPYHRHDVPPSDAPLPGTAAQQAFIKEVASGAMASQQKYGVPASVTIAQAIDESGWGQSMLATNDHNLFGIKGTGPAGSDEQPTQEVINGQVVNLSASFQIYQNMAQSIDAHGRLLAHSGDYAGAMAQSKDPNAFAAALTGVYATDPSYGAKLVQLMRQYDLYRFDRAASHGESSSSGGGGAAGTHHPARPARGAGARQAGGDHHPAHTPPPAASPDPGQPSPRRDHTPGPRQPGPIGNPVPVQPAPIAPPAPGQPSPVGNPVPVEPGAIMRPGSPARDAKPARGMKTGASVPAQRAGKPPPGRPAGHHDAVPPPTATLYPGRSARPAPLAHPARPADLARPSGPATSHDPGAAPAPAPALQPGLWPDPAPDASASATGTANGQVAGHAATGAPAGAASGPGTATWPGPAAGPGQAGVSGEAAIPGVPRTVSTPAGRAHTRRPVSRLRPAHPVGSPTLRASRAQHARPAAPGNGAAAGASAGTQRPAAPAGQPANAAPDPAYPRHRTVPAAAAPTASQAGGAMIPGLQHDGPGTHVAAGASGGAPISPDNGGAATAKPGGSSIPGAPQGAGAGTVSQAAPPAATAQPGGTSIPGARPGTVAGTVPQAASPAAQPGGSSIPGALRGGVAGTASKGAPPAAPAATPGRSPTARAPVAPGQPPAAPGGQAVSPGRPGPRHSPSSPGNPAAGRAQRAATSSRGAARRASPAAAGDAPAPGGSAQPATVPGSAAPARRPAGPGPASASPLPPSANPVLAPASPVPAAHPTRAAASTPAQGGADVPGLVHAAPATARTVSAGPTAHFNGGPALGVAVPGDSPQAPGRPPAGSPAPRAGAGATLTVYRAHMPPSVREAFVTSAKLPLVRAEPLYRDVASHTGIRWEILAACDWMQCKARHGYSPVYGEKLGTLNPDDTCYRTKSAALEQCASDLVQLARSVYQLDIATSQELTVRDLANVFAAFRWGGLLRQHCTSALDFPYSVAGLTADHTHMRWPNIDEPNAPDKPGSRFRQPFGAVPVVLGLNYQALM